MSCPYRMTPSILAPGFGLAELVWHGSFREKFRKESVHFSPIQGKVLIMEHTMQSVLEETAKNSPDDIVVSSYSGRGMCGRQCLAVSFSGSLGQLFAKILYVLDGKKDFGFVAETFENMRQDSLGRGIVVYFPDEEYIVKSEY